MVDYTKWNTQWKQFPMQEQQLESSRQMELSSRQKKRSRVNSLNKIAQPKNSTSSTSNLLLLQSLLNLKYNYLRSCRNDCRCEYFNQHSSSVRSTIPIHL